MKAVVKTNRRKGMQLIVARIPQIGLRDVLIKVTYASICGTDVHIYDWTHWAQERLIPPRIIGHEFVGVVTEIGSEVTQVRVGDRVSAESHISCGYCYQCRNGYSEVCRSSKLLGVDHDGTFAEFMVLPEHVLWKNDPDIPDKWATLQEPFGNAIDTVMAEDVSAKSLLILGAGPIGLFATGIAKASGASLIIVSDPNNYRLNIGKKMGAHLTINPKKEDVVPLVLEATKNNGVDVVLDFSGNNQALNQGLSVITPGGRISILGIYEKRVTLDLNKDVIFKKTRIYGITGRKVFSTWYKTSHFLTSGLMDLNPIITHQFPLHDYEKGIKLMREGKCGKIILGE
ncbi:MAG: L-threonine 3-dehydrogenase [Candidatus Scalindua sp. AMX11]|nr:MAG: L-threonine 3-dehydrogenase [Candidatus Scalindua sp.]NOG85101.1 L-threonine 3-dehydrogenase [Planctomycetota bacterium]RZV69316.1 MAG: L-threonine 3-dehydrogenase [Candidatus Scalindua sp. SCAELEC01]TDE66772.1 MAG: L-threonine 3-dehydrogenase [Candidatus Scalindua sp. AMX11]GJQ60389.1 MAG: L-threonine 3-dehydrogenase [Candidatus Scalindua sp.]